jgi:hypothetical protein
MTASSICSETSHSFEVRLNEDIFAARSAWDKLKNKISEVDSWNMLSARRRNLATALGEACVLGNPSLAVVVRDCLSDADPVTRQTITGAFNDLFRPYGAETNFDQNEGRLFIKRTNPDVFVTVKRLAPKNAQEMERLTLTQEFKRLGSIMVERIRNSR